MELRYLGLKRNDGTRRRADPGSSAGVTLIELTVVLLLLSLSLAAATGVFSAFQSRTAAHRAAQVFALDIGLARTSAVRSRETVVVDFDEAQMTYLLRFESGDTILKREFGESDEIWLDTVNLQLTGDSLAFSSRGVGDLTGAGSSLGVARFVAGDTGYEVSFNGMGASRVDKR